MPTTRRAARRTAAERQLLDLPADALSLVLYQLTLAHDIAAVAPTCHALCNAVKLAHEVRLYHVDGTLVHAFKGHTSGSNALTVTHDGQHIISGSWDNLVKVWSVASKSLVSTCLLYTSPSPRD